MTRTSRVAAVFFLGATAFATQAFAQADRYPSRSIQLVVPWAPSGPTDVFARLIAGHLQSAWGQPVVVDNRAGGSGTIGAAFVARSAPDGYTLLFNSVSNVIAPLLQKTPAYDPVQAFEPVAMTARIPQIIVVAEKVPARNLPEFIAWARQRPGAVNYASPGVGSIAHLVMEMLKERAHIDVVHIPYKGGAPVLSALLANEVQVACSDMLLARPHIDAGKMRALVQLGSERSPLVRDVPAITEAGLPDFGVSFWNGLFAPKGTPVAIVTKLNQEVNRAMASRPIAEKAVAFGTESLAVSPDAFRARIAQDAALYGDLIGRHKIVAE